MFGSGNRHELERRRHSGGSIELHKRYQCTGSPARSVAKTEKVVSPKYPPSAGENPRLVVEPPACRAHMLEPLETRGESEMLEQLEPFENP